jgi:hypothetical protein
MNRRNFSKTALAVAATAMVAPRALAATPTMAPRTPAITQVSILDCVVIDFTRNVERWVPLKHPDFEGRKFVYEPTGALIQYRHFEFLRSDGLVIGGSAKMSYWTTYYDALENEALHLYKPATTKRFDRSEFLTYVEEVRYYLNGRIVPIDQLA